MMPNMSTRHKITKNTRFSKYFFTLLKEKNDRSLRANGHSKCCPFNTVSQFFHATDYIMLQLHQLLSRRILQRRDGILPNQVRDILGIDVLPGAVETNHLLRIDQQQARNQVDVVRLVSLAVIEQSI